MNAGNFAVCSDVSSLLIMYKCLYARVRACACISDYACIYTEMFQIIYQFRLSVSTSEQSLNMWAPISEITSQCPVIRDKIPTETDRKELRSERHGGESEDIRVFTALKNLNNFRS